MASAPQFTIIAEGLDDVRSAMRFMAEPYYRARAARLAVRAKYPTVEDELAGLAVELERHAALNAAAKREAA